MNGAWHFLVAMIFLNSATFAQVPEMGRWQELDFSAAEVHSRTADQYHAILADLAAQSRLDDDHAMLTRVQRVAATLIPAAIAIKPEAADWHWEIHITSDPEVDAFCMAGGKLVVGSRFVHRLDLSDGELATLIGHEVAHAMADHHREALSNARHINRMPATSLDVVMLQIESDLSLQIRLFTLSSIQESETDQLGMLLAHQAGWPVSAMVSFYQKLAATGVPSTMSGSHPSPASRISMAKGLAILFGQ